MDAGEPPDTDYGMQQNGTLPKSSGDDGPAKIKRKCAVRKTRVREN